MTSALTAPSPEHLVEPKPLGINQGNGTEQGISAGRLHEVGAGHHGYGGPGHSSPYVGMEKRAVKALSEQQVADLRAGGGMSPALPAELNGHPGPLHVLKLGDKLGGTLPGSPSEISIATMW